MFTRFRLAQNFDVRRTYRNVTIGASHGVWVYRKAAARTSDKHLQEPVWEHVGSTALLTGERMSFVLLVTWTESVWRGSMFCSVHGWDRIPLGSRSSVPHSIGTIRYYHLQDTRRCSSIRLPAHRLEDCARVKVKLNIIIIIIIENTWATYQETMKSRNYRKQTYWALHTYFGKY